MHIVLFIRMILLTNCEYSSLTIVRFFNRDDPTFPRLIVSMRDHLPALIFESRFFCTEQARLLVQLLKHKKVNIYQQVTGLYRDGLLHKILTDTSWHNPFFNSNAYYYIFFIVFYLLYSKKETTWRIEESTLQFFVKTINS